MGLSLAMTERVFVGGLYRDAPIEHLNSKAPKFSDLLKANGVEIASSLSQASTYLCLDVDPYEIKEKYRDFLKVERRVLIRQEPRVVRPQNYKSAFLRHFEEIFEVGRVEQTGTHGLLWPQVWREVDPSSPEAQRSSDSVVMIAGNRLSLVAGEQYSLRRSCIRTIDKLSVFGQSWRISPPARLRQLIVTTRDLLSSQQRPHFSPGLAWMCYSNSNIRPVVSKHETLSKWKVSLVIENSQDVFTEKLFDSLFALTIPVYVGPNLTHFPIPRDLYVQADPTLESITGAIDHALSMDYEKWRTKAHQWLSEGSTKDTWGWDSFVKTIANLL